MECRAKGREESLATEAKVLMLPLAESQILVLPLPETEVFVLALRHSSRHIH